MRIGEFAVRFKSTSILLLNLPKHTVIGFLNPFLYTILVVIGFLNSFLYIIIVVWFYKKLDHQVIPNWESNFMVKTRTLSFILTLHFLFS